MSEPLKFTIELIDEHPPGSAALAGPPPGPSQPTPTGLQDIVDKGPPTPTQALPTAQQMPGQASSAALGDQRHQQTVPVAILGPFPIPVSVHGLGAGLAEGAPPAPGPEGTTPQATAEFEEREEEAARERSSHQDFAPPTSRARSEAPDLTQPMEAADTGGWGGILKVWAEQSGEAIAGILDKVGLAGPLGMGELAKGTMTTAGAMARKGESEEKIQDLKGEGGEAESEGFRGGETPMIGGEGAAEAGGEAAEAGAMAGEVGEVAMAAEAGPAAPIVIAAEEVKKQIIGAIDFFGDAVQKVGSVTTKLASNDNLGALTESSEVAAKGLKELGPMGEIAGHAVEAGIKMVGAFDQVTTAFIERGRQISMYSGEMTTAIVQADVRSMMADIREAQEMGPGTARLIEAQSQLSTEFRDLMLPVKEWIVNVLANMMETIRDAVHGTRITIAAVEAVLEQGFKELLTLLAAITPGTGVSIADGMEHLKNLGPAFKKAIDEALAKLQEPKIDEWLGNAMDDLNNQIFIIPQGVNPPGVPSDPFAPFFKPSPTFNF